MTFGRFIGGLAVALALGTAAQAADYRVHKTYSRDIAMERGYTGALPSCADPAVEARVASAFSGNEREYWASDLQLTGFTKIRELGYRTWGHSFIPRRFCIANVVTTDGRKRSVSYNIAEWQGAGTLSWGVEWCVTGLDRHYAYAPACKMARP